MTDDVDRCWAAGIPDDLAFATKPVQAARMIGRALDTGSPARWVAGDEVYGDNPHLRAPLETLDRLRPGGLQHHQVTTAAGKFPAKAIVAKIPGRAWQRRSARAGALGERYYDWAQADIHGPADRPGHWWLLVRPQSAKWRTRLLPLLLARPVPLSDLVRVAGRRWTVEETFQAGKGLAGLHEHQVRRWTSWHRWVTLAMLALAFLVVTAAAEGRDHPAPDDLIPLTCNEIQRLFTTFTSRVHDLAHRLRWSHWRRRHQARARNCHYQRQAAT
ncbi:transposase [Streptomyces fradiae]|uniref:IS701 family transposase n=1 Tax=Streptomyces fradiae TaxID=1906 RepID=UPI0035119F11